MFVHLHNHSQYSILDASSPVEEIAKCAQTFGMPAVALTDHGNLFGAVEFYKACQYAQVKPIIGCELYVAPDSRHEKKKQTGSKNAYHLTLLAENAEGYQNLCKLSSIGFLEGFYYHPRIDLEVLEKYSKGLICLSGCLSSHVSQTALNATKEQLKETIYWYKNLFQDNYYLELQRHPMSEIHLEQDGYYRESWLIQQYQDYIQKQNQVNTLLIELSKEFKIPTVATNDCHFIHREDWRAHEILLNVQSGEPVEIWEKDSLGQPKFCTPNPRRRTYSSHECYFKSPAEMGELFKDLPEAIQNSLEIADRCTLKLDFKTKHYPVYLPPSLQDRPFTKEERAKEVENYLWQLCEEGIPKRYTPERLAKIKEHYPDRDPMDVVRMRLNYEMSVIIPKEMGDYLLIVWDFIHWAKQNDIPVGPGRGSGAGSIVLYLIGVTDIEPLRFHLFFERFINPERLSYPDIDVDICMEQRSEVIAYTLRKYGKDNIAQIINFGTMKAKSVIRDVGRTLNIPLQKVNTIAKLVPEDLNITLDKALEKDPELKAMYEQDNDAHRIIDIGRKLEGSVRNTGIHAAGIVICGEPLTDYIPLCVAKDSEMAVTQFSMKPVELVGMLKIDFLGLKTLTCIKICCEALKETHPINWMDLPLDDGPTFALLNQGKTQGIFQLESEGMQKLAHNLHLDRFEEIIAVGALYRPGPMDMIPSFINRKHGREAIEYDHPWMKDILAETYGIMVYQEQVMQIASKLANYTLGEGDVLRRAMGKKDLEQMASQREKFRNGAKENGIDEETSMRIFDKIEKFAAYGFNKSHAAAYGYLSYVTAYLKANHPKEWLAALMTCDRDDLTKVTKFIRECQAMQIAVLPPDINESSDTFTATPQGIRFALSGIKGIGTGVVELIIQERKRSGPFLSLYHFIKRIDTRKVGKKTIENLIDAGCVDFTGWSRDALRKSLDPMYDTISLDQKEAQAGILSLFSRIEGFEEKRFAEPPEVRHPSSKMEMLLKEKELLGFFLTGHPLDSSGQLIQQLSCIPLSKIETMDHDSLFRATFIIETIQVKLAAKSQRKFAILSISDGIERYELPIWPDLYEQKILLMRENQLIFALLQVEKTEEGKRISCRFLDDLTKVDEQMIQECDKQFDKSKQMAARMSSFKKKAPEPPQTPINQTQTPKGPMEEKPLEFTINADQVRFSQVLDLKRLFEKHRGTCPVRLQFLAEEREIATLHIDSRWGVNNHKELLSEIQKIFL